MPFLVSNQPTTELLGNSGNLLMGSFHNFRLFLQVSNVRDPDSQARVSGLRIAQSLHIIQQVTGPLNFIDLEDLRNDVRQEAFLEWID